MNIPHPFPYQGSKRNIAKAILRYFPKQVDRLIEPFAGSAAISIAAAFYDKAKFFIINDLNKALIALWEMIIFEPQKLSDEYRNLWYDQLGIERDYYDKVRASFNKSQHPSLFLYLLARCVKGSIRYNSNGEFNQSPDNRRKGMNPDKMRENIFGVSELFKNKSKLFSKDYKEILNLASYRDIIYMDPPYQGVCGKRDPRYINGLSFEEFIDSLDRLNNRSISYILSYDGRREDKIYGKSMPKYLALSRIEIDAGPSTQATLLGKRSITHESLYLSPALINRIEKIKIEKVLSRPKQLSLFEHAQI